MSESITTCLQGANGFLEGFLIIFTDTHDFAYGAHLGTQLVLNTFEFFKCPAGKFDHYVITVRNIFIKRSVFTAGDILQGQSCCQHGGNQCNWKSRSFGCQSGRTGGTWIDLNNNNTVCHGIMGELHIGSSDDLHGFHDFICLLLQPLLTFLGNGKHRRRTEGISCMHPKRINVFDKTYGNDIVVGITDNLKLKLLPSENGFLHQNLSNQRCLQTSCTDCF